MLRLHQSSSSSSSSSSRQNLMELSVLERHSAILQRLYQDQENAHLEMHSAIDHHHQTPSNGPYRPDWQCNSTRQGTKKRKAEFDIEEECKDKRVIEEEEEEAGEENSEITMKTEMETSATNTCSKVEKLDYIHVRARRGQATDSHSLAERARREKISKKMKCLQDLVPGCNKVTGKAGMLDEIINYVQSLQKQVEFLSMKLATINPRLDFSIDDIIAKEAYMASLPAAQYEAACFHYNTMQQGTSNPGANISLDQSQFLPQKPGSSSLQIPEMLLDPTFISQLQQLSGFESDWPSLFNAGFH